MFANTPSPRFAALALVLLSQLQAPAAATTSDPPRRAAAEDERVLSPLGPGSPLCTSFGGFGALTTGGFYLNLSVTNPAGLTITQIGVLLEHSGVPLTLVVYAKAGSHVGFEGNAAAWSRVGSGSATSGAGFTETVVNISDFCLPPGQWALALDYRTTPGTERWRYGIATIPPSNSDLAISGGVRWTPLFVGTAQASGIFNGCIRYTVGGPAGALTTVASGCTNSTGSAATLTLQGGGVPEVGTTANLAIANAPHGTPIAAILFGFMRLAPPSGVSLGLIGGLNGCNVHVQSVTTLPIGIDGSGAGVAPISLPLQSLGLTFFAEGAMFDAASPANLKVVVSSTIQGLVGC